MRLLSSLLLALLCTTHLTAQTSTNTTLRICLNGAKLVVKGINRHCFHPETGRALSPAMSLQDAQLIK